MLSDGTTTTVLATRNQTTPCGGVLRGFNAPLAIDGTGTHVVFSADLAAPTGGGLFVADSHGLTALACEKAATPLGGTYRRSGHGRRSTPSGRSISRPG